ncbi:hypothetical protein ACFQ3Z_02065 [Streptomyces nogalater]
MTDAPAFIRNGRLDILATSRLGKALYRPLFQDPARPLPVPTDPGLTLTAEKPRS